MGFHLHLNEILYYILFASFHVAACNLPILLPVSMIHSCSLLCGGPQGEYTAVVFFSSYHSSVEKQLGRFSLWAVTNKVKPLCACASCGGRRHSFLLGIYVGEKFRPGVLLNLTRSCQPLFQSCWN